MANKKISEMPMATELLDGDIVPIVQGGINKKMELGLMQGATYVIETGSNANGSYRKWSNGDLEQWGIKEYTNVPVTVSSVGGHMSERQNIQYPIPFASGSQVFLLVNSYNLGSRWGCGGGGSSNTTGQFRITSVIAGTAPTFPVAWQAKGTWKPSGDVVTSGEQAVALGRQYWIDNYGPVPSNYSIWLGWEQTESYWVTVSNSDTTYVVVWLEVFKSDGHIVEQF